jgi:hypothetical protein
MRRPWPSDQVTIDGQHSSSTQERNGAAETLGFHRGIEVLTAVSLDGEEGVGDGGEGSWWSRLSDGEVVAAPDDGVLEEVLQALRLGVAVVTCSAGPSQNGEYG